MFHILTAPIGFLSSKRMLDIYLRGEVPNNKDMNLELFLSQREHIFYLPNQIHNNNRLQNGYKEEDTLSNIFDKSIRQLTELLYCEDDKVYVKKGKLSVWQSVLINISPIPIIAWLLMEKCPSNYLYNNQYDMSSLPTVKNDFMDKEEFAFSELHIHINGTSESIHNWLHFLQNEGDIYKVVKTSYDKVTIQYKQLGIETVGTLTEIILKAKYVREFLLDYINNVDELESKLNKKFKTQWKDYFANNWNDKIPYERIINFENSNIYTLQSELDMWYRLFYIIKTKNYSKAQKNILYMLMHYYILSMSLFNRFLIQQSDQYGFSQFQLITDNKLRDVYEDEGYKDRYLQLKGIYNTSSDLSHLELRFAPKDTVEKMTKLYQRIIKDYYHLKVNNNIEYDMSMIAHFIKFPDSNNTDGLPLSCRWANTRVKLQKQAVALLAVIASSYRETIFKESSYKQNDDHFFLGDENIVYESEINFFDKFVGIDGAGNELYARPEIFAPTFNYLNQELKERFNKKLNITFHAGEDYVHLFSGIRYVWEAIHFLGMTEDGKWSQCRIGHATALGIEPKFWSDKLDGAIVMSKGEWLDNMIFAKNYLNTSKYDRKIEQFWQDVYGEIYINDDAWQAYQSRKKNPYEASVPEIVKLYNSPNVVQKYNEVEQVLIDSKDIEIMLECQRKLLQEMKQYEIAIESMITSNVRISYYEKYEEHHIYRWLFPEGVEKDIMPPIVLSSDDPGLFNNNMRIEFSHLYEILRKKGKSESEIEDKIQELQENAKEYTFK